MAHGFRADPIFTRSGGFKCRVCDAVIVVGQSVVGFKNDNRAWPNGWDHVCAEGCADVYNVPALAVVLGAKASSSGARAAIRRTVSGAASAVVGVITGKPSSAAASPTKQAAFERRVKALDIRQEHAEQVLCMHGGDAEAAMADITREWMEECCAEIAATEGATEDTPVACSAVDSTSEEDELPEAAVDGLKFGSNDARAAVLDVFQSFVKPLIPKPQSSGGFKDGDAELLDSLMSTPKQYCTDR